MPRFTSYRRHISAGLVLAGTLGATGCGATRSRLDASAPWQYATRAAEHPPAALEVVKPRSSALPIPEQLPEALKERVTLRSEAVDIRSLLLGLAKQTGLNIVLEPDVTGQVSAYFNDAPVIDVLRNIGEQLNIEVEVRGTSVTVHRPRHEYRTFRLSYLRTPRAGQTNIGIYDRAITSVGTTTTSSSNATAAMAALSGANSPGGIIVPEAPKGGGSVTQVMSVFGSNFWADLSAELEMIVFDGVSERELSKKEMGYAGVAISDAGGRSLVVDSMSGTIQVRARRQVLDAIAEYLEAVDLTIHRQVVIDVKVLEVSLSDGKVFGLETSNAPFLPSSLLSGQNGAPDGVLGQFFGQTGYTGYGIDPTQANTATARVARVTGTGTIKSGFSTPLGFLDPSAQLSDSNPAANPKQGVYSFNLFDQFTGATGNSFPFRVMLQMMAKLGDVKVVTAPRLTALHNQKAVLKVVRDRVFYLIRAGTYTPATATTPALVTGSEVMPFVVPEGIIMDVTPVIDDNGDVTMEIHPSFSVIYNEKMAPNSAGSQPEVERREFHTTVRVKGEETVVLGGLVSERTSRVETGIPYLKDIPVLGNLFRTTTDAHEKSEIILLLTPRIQGAKLLKEYVDEFRAMDGQGPMKEQDKKSSPSDEKSAPPKG